MFTFIKQSTFYFDLNNCQFLSKFLENNFNRIVPYFLQVTGWHNCGREIIAIAIASVGGLSCYPP